MRIRSLWLLNGWEKNILNDSIASPKTNPTYRHSLATHLFRIGIDRDAGRGTWQTRRNPFPFWSKLVLVRMLWVHSWIPHTSPPRRPHFNIMISKVNIRVRRTHVWSMMSPSVTNKNYDKSLGRKLLPLAPFNRIDVVHTKCDTRAFGRSHCTHSKMVLSHIIFIFVVVRHAIPRLSTQSHLGFSFSTARTNDHTTTTQYVTKTYNYNYVFCLRFCHFRRRCTHKLFHFIIARFCANKKPDAVAKIVYF